MDPKNSSTRRFFKELRFQQLRALVEVARAKSFAGQVAGTAVDLALTPVNPCGKARWAAGAIRGLSVAQGTGHAINAGEAAASGDFVGAGMSLMGARASFAKYNASCFVAGTPLLTPDGHKAIEDFQVGDLILSKNECDPDGEVTVRRVLQTFVRVTEVLDLIIEGQVIGTTAEHPFFIRGKGWLPGLELRAGDEVLTHEGRWIPIAGVNASGRIATVYNLEAEEDHTYFVGERSWGWSAWSHNAQCLPITGRSPHGSPVHNSRMVNAALHAQSRTGVTGVRTNQALVDATGQTVSKFRPDVQYLQNGLVHIIEVNVSGGASYHKIREQIFRHILGNRFGSYMPG